MSLREPDFKRVEPSNQARRVHPTRRDSNAIEVSCGQDTVNPFSIIPFTLGRGGGGRSMNDPPPTSRNVKRGMSPSGESIEIGKYSSCGYRRDGEIFPGEE